MSTISERVLPQTVVIQNYVGSGPTGPVYGDPITWPARVEFSYKLVRDKSGAQVVSASQVYLPAAAVGQVGVGSRITLPGASSARTTITYAPSFGGHEYHHVRVDVT